MLKKSKLSKELEDYHKTYLKKDAFSWPVVVNSAPHLMKQLSEMKVAKCKGHPPFDKVKSYEIVRCGKIWVILATVLCSSDGIQDQQKFEMAMGIDKNELGIWWDLHCVNRN